MELSIVAGAALAVAAGGIFPWINAEAVVGAAALVTPRAHVPSLVAACAVTQMASKLVLYAIARWMPERMPERARRLLARVEPFGDRRALLAASVVSSSMIALPPLYFVTLACGALRVPVAHFALAGLSGTLVRYGAIALAAQALTTG
jgi:membrane protein YqaA with SNARE-associated domain